jgi:carotenoid cleavage dioxygenase
MIQEPCFVPRTPDSPEGDGWIIALVDNLVTNYSDLVVLDALWLEDGPVARAKLMGWTPPDSIDVLKWRC